MTAARSSSGTSLQRRLGLGLAAGVSVLWLAATLLAGNIIRSEVGEVFDSALQEVAQRLLPLAYAEVLARDETTPDMPAQRIASVGTHDDYITYVVRDAAGRVLMQSTDADPSVFPTDPAPGFQNGPTHRFYTESAVRGTLRVTTAEVLRHRETTVARAVGMLMWPLAALIPIGLIGVWATVRLSLRPVRAFREEIEARGQGNLAPIAAKGLPAELAPMAVAVDRLIGRLRGALEAERSFTANSAHELRTPIAAALAQCQRLMSELSDETARERARAIAGALRRLSRLSEKLLQLAKAEGGGGLAETPQDVGRILRLVLEDVDRHGDTDGRLQMRIAEAPVWSAIDGDAFAILARNLVENALKHGAAETPVVVGLDGDGVFEVANDCETVPQAVLTRLTQPFERGGSQAQGSGLGLAIAEAISRGAGTVLELMSPAPGRDGGFLARVRLPKADALPPTGTTPAA